MNSPLINDDTIRSATIVTLTEKPTVDVGLANGTYYLHDYSSSPSETSEENEMNCSQCKVLYFIYLDSLLSFLYLFVNPYFGLYAGCNLLFSYIGYIGVKKFDSTHLGTYILYNVLRVIGMIIFGFSTILYRKKMFGSGENSETNYIVFASSYTIMTMLYSFFLHKMIQLNRLYV